MIYGYARISRPQQSIQRQIRNIEKLYPKALILQEAYTGTKNSVFWDNISVPKRFSDILENAIF